MNSFHLDENDHQDAASIPTGVETMRTDEDGVWPWSQLPAPVIEKIYSFLNRRDQISMSSVCRNWREQYSSPSLWSQLPAPVIEKIYSFVNRRDQISMSSVCRNWREEYSSPSLWRRMEFPLSDFRNIAELCTAAILARRYGAMFHHVEVRLDGSVLSYSASLVFRQMKLFCEALTRSSQLLSISFRSLVLLRYVDGPGTLVCQEILKLLKSQNRLLQVEFNLCYFEKAQAAEILNVIFANNYKTLRCMSLKQFYIELHGEELRDSTVDDDLNFMALMNLETLDMNYCQIFVYMMLSFYDYRDRVDMRAISGSLREIRLHAIHCENCDYVRIDPLVWKYFRRIFPSLRVELTLYCNCDSSTLDIFLTPNMPLKSLKFTLWNVQDRELGFLLRHITSCELNESLEELTINWAYASTNLAPDLIRFTNICSKLKTLNLKILHPVEAVALDAVFDSWLQNRPTSLDIVKITIVTDEEQIYAHLNDTYAPQLHPLELNVSVIVRP